MTADKLKYPGPCMLCKKVINKGQMTRHLKKCVEKNCGDGGRSMKLFHLVVEGKYLPMYWLHLGIPGAMTLADLDALFCDDCLDDDIDEGFLPVVNSPRVGVCAYGV